MNRPLSVEDIERDVADVVQFAQRVLDDYRWLHASGYARSVRSTGTSGADPAGLTASVEHAKVREQLGHASAKVRRAARELYGAHNALDRAYGVLDRRVPAAETTDQLDQPASHADLRHAEQAQDRRKERMRLHATPWSHEEVTG